MSMRPFVFLLPIVSFIPTKNRDASEKEKDSGRVLMDFGDD